MKDSDSQYKHVGFALFHGEIIGQVLFGDDAEQRAWQIKRSIEKESTGIVNIEVRQVFSKVKHEHHTV
jgi:hypothetical protein